MPLTPAPPRRILVVQTQRLGDVLCATPVFTTLRTAYPEAHLAALIHRPFDQLLESQPELDDVLVVEAPAVSRTLAYRLRLAAELRRRRYDWALVIHAAASIAFALWLSGVPRRTCVWRYGDRLKPHWWRSYHQYIRQDRENGGKHEIESNLDVLRELGISSPALGYRLTLRPAEREAARVWLRERGRDEARPLAVLHPGHGGGRQAWAPECYAEVGMGLTERGFQVAVTGSSGERALVDRVAVGLPGALALAGGTDLRGLAALIGEASLMVSVSTGPMHLASALGVPAVTLYGPTEHRCELTRFCPYGSPARPVVSPVPCICRASRDCLDAVCMRGITPTMVLTAAAELSP